MSDYNQQSTTIKPRGWQRNGKDVDIVFLVVALVILCPAALISLAILNHGYTEYFPMGYRLWRAEGREQTMVFETNPADYYFLLERGILDRVRLDVDGYRVYPRMIIGHVGSNPGVPSLERYFIIELGSDAVYMTVNKQEWLANLRECGISQELELFRPSPLGMFLGHNKPQPPYQ